MERGMSFGACYTYQVPYKHTDKVTIMHNGEILEIQLIAFRIYNDYGNATCIYTDSLNRRWKDQYLIDNEIKENQKFNFYEKGDF